MKILTTTEFYTAEFLRAHPDKVFVFGDNILRRGHGGQAAIRDEPNTFGICTKWAPSDGSYDFFDYNPVEAIREICEDFYALSRLHHNKTIVFPILKTTPQLTSLGCGLADLPNRNPAAYQIINLLIGTLINESNRA